MLPKLVGRRIRHMEETTGRQSLLPRWFEELCERIASGNADNAPDNGPPITHVNLNLRRLSYPMTDALVHALSQTSRIQAINLTWSLVHMDTCSDQNLMALADVLRYHPSLEVVHLATIISPKLVHWDWHYPPIPH